MYSPPLRTLSQGRPNASDEYCTEYEFSVSNLTTLSLRSLEICLSVRKATADAQTHVVMPCTSYAFFLL